MCWEDVELGAHTAHVFHSLTTLAGANTPVLPRNPNRRFIILGSPTSGNITYRTSTLAGLLGLNIAANLRPVFLTYEQHGSLVTSEWHAFHAAAVPFAVIEGIFDAEYARRIRKASATVGE